MKLIKKTLLILGSIILAFLLMSVAMFMFKICPPQGPWIMPPWCSVVLGSNDKTDVTFYVSLDQPTKVNLNVGNKPIELTQIGFATYSAKATLGGKIDYSYTIDGTEYKFSDTITRNDQTISNAILTNKKDFKKTLGVYMMDTWGKNYNFLMFEDTRNNIDSSFARLKEDNVKEVFVNDFHMLVFSSGDFSLTNTNYTIEPEIFSNDFRDEAMTQEDLNHLAGSAHKNDLKIGWKTSMHFWDIGKYISKGITGDISSAVASDFAEFNKPKNEIWVKDFLAKYKEFLLKKADQLNEAGFDVMILTPGYMTPDYAPYDELANQEWKQIITEVKARFKGKVAYEISSGHLMLTDSTWKKNHDFWKTADVTYVATFEMPDGYKVKGDNYESIKSALQKYYGELNAAAKQENVRISIMARFNSHTDAINNGLTELLDMNNPKIKNLASDYTHQANCYQAFFESTQNQSQFDELVLLGYWWDDAMDPKNAKVFVSKSATPRNKPAESVLKLWGQKNS